MSKNSKFEALLDQAWRARGEGQYSDARKLATEAEQLCADDDHNLLGRVCHIYMQIEADHDDFTAAMWRCLKSRAHYQKAQYLNRVAHSTRHIADLHRELRQNEAAERNYVDAIAMYESNPDTNPVDLTNAYYGYALLLEQCDKIADAVSVLEKTKKLYGSCNFQEGVDDVSRKIEQFTSI